MTPWAKVGAGAGGTLATIGLEQVNGYVALACGLLTFALLARSVFFTFRRDLRRARIEAGNQSAADRTKLQNAPDRPE